MKIKLLFFSIIVLFSTASCRLVPFDEVSTESQSEWAVPLIDTKKSVNDLVKGFDKEAFLQIAPDGLLVLHYKGNFAARSSLDIFANFQDVLFPITDTAMAIPFSLPSGVDIDAIDAKKGVMIWTMVAPDDNLLVTLKIPQMTKNGIPFSKTFPLTRLPLKDSLNFAGWHFEPKNGAITIIHDARRVTDNSRVNLTSKAFLQIQNFEFSFTKGYFGAATFDAPRDTIEMDFIQNLNQGELRFEDPRMTFTLDNSFGIPVKAVTQVADIIRVNGQRLALKSAFTEGVAINYPKLTEIGQTKRTQVVLDKNNSNLVDIISSNPRAIDYDIDGLTNPDKDQGVRGFMTDSSAFKLQVEVDLPIHGSAKNFTISDTFPINLKRYDQLTNAALKVATENGMPVDIGVQGYFTTANGTVLDSFYQKNVSSLMLKAAPVNAQGLPTSIQKQENQVDIDAEKLKRILPATKMIIRLLISTTNSGTVPVKLMKTQDVRIQVGLKFGVKTK